MKVNVKLFATLRKYLPSQAKHQVSLELSDDATIRQVLDQLSVPEPDVAFVFVNSKREELDHTLSDGDELGVFPPIAGG